MTFVQTETRNGMINLDGYSRNKTLKGALMDLAREVAKIDEGEGHTITNNIDEYTGMVVDGMPNEAGCYYIEAEEVHCATRYSEKKDEMEYAEGHWYLYIRFCAPEQESEEPETSATEKVTDADATASTDTPIVSKAEGMKKDILKIIKNDMWDTLSNKKHLQAHLKKLLAEVERQRKDDLAEHDGIEDMNFRKWLNQQTNEIYDRRRREVIDEEYECWHNDQMYYLIYKDGSEVVISAEEIISGVKFPKVSDVVYAEMSSADDHMDTETGDLYWYSDERMKACDWNYDAEDEAIWQYETVIQYKFGTVWAKRWAQDHPEFVPIAI